MRVKNVYYSQRLKIPETPLMVAIFINIAWRGIAVKHRQRIDMMPCCDSENTEIEK